MIKNFIINQAKCLLGPPRQNYEVFFLNLLGFQIFRYLIAYFKYKKKAKKNSNILNNLEKNGYVIIKNFFPNEKFKNILEIAQKIENYNLFTIKKYGNKKVHSFDFFYDDCKKFPDLEKSILNLKDEFNKIDFLNEVFNLLKIKKEKISNLSYEKIVTQSNFIDEGDNDSEYHADRFYPCIKIFLYLDDNKLENGAFEYVKGSHRFSLSRLVHEYVYSILICGKKLFKNIMPYFGYQLINNRVTFTNEKIIKLYGSDSLVKCEAPINSLIICNNKGFHKRGRFQANKCRTHLRLNLYDQQISSIKRKIFIYAKKLKKKN
jgi:hypothetical protein